MTSAQPADTAKAKVPKEVVEEVVKAYYPALVSSADTARTRAQSGYAIASAVAAAIVAAGVFGDFTSAARPVKILGVVALILWLAAAAAYIYAVSGPVPLPEGNASDDTEFVLQVVHSVTRARKMIEDRGSRAQIVTVLAIAATVAAVTVASFIPSADAKVAATVFLSPSGITDASTTCAEPITALRGQVDPASLGQSTLTIVADAGNCGAGSPTLHLRSADVRSIVQGLTVAPREPLEIVQISFTARGRSTLGAQLGPKCQLGHVRAVRLNGSAKAPLLLTVPRRHCRGLEFRLAPSLGALR